MVTIREMFPRVEFMSAGSNKLYVRNLHILLGIGLDTPVDLVIAYNNQKTGGTVVTIEMARALGIEVEEMKWRCSQPVQTVEYCQEIRMTRIATSKDALSVAVSDSEITAKAMILYSLDGLEFGPDLQKQNILGPI
jgi:hypothetical protein